jgi:hypothetical protein
MFTSGKGLTAEGLYKTDMLTAMAEQKMLNVVGKKRGRLANGRTRRNACSARPGKSTW